ncbi:MAG: MMPL family transporter [Erysipelotrichaceae bacterium]|nr:MMPL family transporter [Erysipelotrichaceae bacterium]
MKKIAASYYDDYLLAGNVPSSYDMKDITTSDMSRVNTVAIVAVFIVIVLTTRTVLLPLILVFIIEGAIWVNLAMSALTGSSMFYINYLIISSIQLGATVDYAISLSDRYLEARKTREKGKALAHTMHYGSLSILTSGSILTIAGLILGISSTHGVLKELGMLLFKGTLLSMIFVLFALPGFMFLLDKWIMKYRFSRDRKEFIGYEK